MLKRFSELMAARAEFLRAVRAAHPAYFRDFRRHRGRRYNAARGGPAPGHLREALLACLDDSAAEHWYDKLTDDETLIFHYVPMQIRWEKMTLRERARWLCGQLWNCTDILPGMACADLDLPEGSTYARAVRKLRDELEEEYVPE